MIPFIPKVLAKLWELGSVPEYIIELVERNIPHSKLKSVIDLGCGKGAVLIQLSEKIKFQGVGIDLMAEFIDEAKLYASQRAYSKNLKFEIADIKKAVEKYNNFDLVIYGHDSDVFGNITQSLFELEKYMSNQGWIILEAYYSNNSDNNRHNLPTETEFSYQIKESAFKIVDQIIWDEKKLRDTNQSNTALIREQIVGLIESNPDKKQMLNNYLANQIEECNQLENNVQCLTILLQRKKSENTI
jgi:cyclopropane fatty-acyl-phospholipid synthase-like methyltransferase